MEWMVEWWQVLMAEAGRCENHLLWISRFPDFPMILGPSNSCWNFWKVSRFQKLQQRNMCYFFSWIIIGRILICGLIFFCEFFRPNKMMDLLRPWQFQVSDFPFMDPSSAGFLRGFLLPGGQHDPSLWNGGQIFSLPGTVHSQNMVSNLIFNVTYASMELLSAQNPCVLLLEPPAVPTWSTGKLEVEERYPRSHASADLSDGFGVGNWFWTIKNAMISKTRHFSSHGT